jgi:hypothetical protein
MMILQQFPPPFTMEIPSKYRLDWINYHGIIREMVEDMDP